MGARVRRGYGVIHSCVMEFRGLSMGAKCLYSLLQSYQGDDEKEKSIAELAGFLGCKGRILQKWKGELIAVGLLEVERREGKMDVYHPLLPLEKNGWGGVHPGAPVHAGAPLTRPDAEPDSSGTLAHGKSDDASSPPIPPRGESGEPDIPYFGIIDYLNETAGTHYRDTTPATKRLIVARWKEGFRGHDFELVIDGRWEEWKDDKSMRQYMRPITLFGTKFESYLQAARSKRPA